MRGKKRGDNTSVTQGFRMVRTPFSDKQFAIRERMCLRMGYSKPERERKVPIRKKGDRKLKLSQDEIAMQRKRNHIRA